MDPLINYLQQDFKVDRDLWERMLKSELKLDDISGKTFKKTLEGNVPTLSTSAPVTHLLEVGEKWKKSAQTYVKPDPDMIREDLEGGVRVFFFQTAPGPEIEKMFNSFPKKEELVIYRLDDDKLCSGRRGHDQGGNNVQELALLAESVFQRLHSPGPLVAGVFLDSQIFKNIAKLRAARLLIQKILHETEEKREITIVGLTSMREWTLYERYSNMLRNVASVASGYLGGADHVQSTGYQTLLELETGVVDAAHRERSFRMARNTGHILALESMLGVVEDPAFGSHHLETLTEEYCQKSWDIFRHDVGVAEKDIQAVCQEREKRVEMRNHVLAGMNDFPDVTERLQLTTTPKALFYRVSRRFEDLRLKMEKAPKRPEVYIAIFGDYASLNARINFVKNYFELLGLKVTDPGHGISATDLASRKEEIVVLCASDETVPTLAALQIPADGKFVAGKVELPGFKNLFAGQNVYEVLQGLVSKV